MVLFGAFDHWNEFYVWTVGIMCGLSMLMPINAVFSAPGYIMGFYKYTTGDFDHVEQYPNFWKNALTFYNLINFCISICMEPLTLTPWIRRVPLTVRFLGSLSILICELVMFLVVPAIGVSEAGAIATLCVGGFMSGTGKSLLESTVYGTFTAFPHKYFSAVLAGSGISGVLTSTIQVIILASIPSGTEFAYTQSRIYYGLAMGIQGATFVMLILLRYNHFARKHVGEYGYRAVAAAEGERLERGRRSTRPDDVAPNTASDPRDPRGGSAVVDSVPGGGHAVPRLLQASGEGPAHVHEGVVLTESDEEVRQRTKSLPEEPLADETGSTESQEMPTELTTTMLLRTSIRPVFKKIYPMTLSCACVFMFTLLVFPNITIWIDRDDRWFGTVVVLLFNVGDLIGRFSTTFKILWAPRWFVIGGSLGRIVFVPLIVLASFQYIPSRIFGYIVTVLFGLTNGYFGGLSMVYGPQTKTLSGDGERFVAGTMMGISLLFGGVVGTSLSIMIQSVRPS